MTVDHDPVNHPRHYTSSSARCPRCGNGIECIDVVRHMPFNVGNVIKYLWRADLKGATVEDLRKARWYLDDEIKRRQDASVDYAQVAGQLELEFEK